VGLSDCLSVSSHISETTQLNFTRFFVHVVFGLVSIGIVISYLLLVLWISYVFVVLCFHIMVCNVYSIPHQ